MTEGTITHGSGHLTKDTSSRAEPKRRTGGGPAPARQIPWSEIFKHHISNIEGHLRMIEMVRKHTVEGSGESRTIMGCVDRTREMLQKAKQVSRNFVPPSGLRDQVPLGSSSASMYPGYAKDRMNGSGGGKSDGHGPEVSIKPNVEESATNGQASKERDQEALSEEENPYFVIDTNPTPEKIPEMSSKLPKRNVSLLEDVETRKHKKAKSKHDGEIFTGEATQEVETEDITEKVDARMKDKEKKRKIKEKKKRKRSSEGDHAAAGEESQHVTEPSATVEEVKRPKKKKKFKKSEEEALPDRTISKKRPSEGEQNAEEEAGKMKNKRRRKNVRTANL